MDTCESQSGSLDQSPAQTSPSIDQTLPGIGGLYPQLSRLFRSSTHSPRLVDRPHLRLRQLVSNSLLDRDLFKGSPFAVLLTVGSPICPICPHVGQLAPTQIRIRSLQMGFRSLQMTCRSLQTGLRSLQMRVRSLQIHNPKPTTPMFSTPLLKNQSLGTI